MAEPASTAQIFQAFKRGRRNAGKPVTQKYHEPILAVVACTQRSSALALSGLDPVTTVGTQGFTYGVGAPRYRREVNAHRAHRRGEASRTQEPSGPSGFRRLGSGHPEEDQDRPCDFLPFPGYPTGAFTQFLIRRRHGAFHGG